MNDDIYSKAEIDLETPKSKTEFVAYHMFLAYKKDYITWYDLAKVALESSKIYDERHEEV